MRTRFSFGAASCLIFLAISGSVPVASAQARLGVFVTPVPNAPFSGVVHVERSVVQRDGSMANLKTFREIGRDSKGRIYSEARMLLPASSAERPQILNILLYDPQTRTSTTLHPQQQTFSQGTVNRPPETAPPAFLDASSAGNSLPQSQFTKHEDLGTHEIEGVPAPDCLRPVSDESPGSRHLHCHPCCAAGDTNSHQPFRDPAHGED